jgi:hypothetical protein
VPDRIVRADDVHHRRRAVRRLPERLRHDARVRHVPRGELVREQQVQRHSLKESGARRRVLAIAAPALCAGLALHGCGSSPGGAGGSGGGADAGAPDASSGGGAPTDPCDAAGVSKGPWVQQIDASHARVRWEACKSSAGDSIRYKPSSGGAEQTKRGGATKYVVKSTYGAVLNPSAPPDEAGTYYLHEVEIAGLSEGTCYDYAIDGDAQRSGAFCTARASGQPLRFLAIGDTNVGLGGSTAGILEHVLPMRPEFTVHGGDLEYYDSELDTWSLWFQVMQPLLANGAFYPAIGNHESENPSEYDQFSLAYFGTAGFDGDSTHYTFDTAGIHFFCLDTQESIYPGELQGTWLSEELEKATHAPGFRFSIVYFHKPLVTCGDTDDDPTGRSLLEPLFVQYKVPLVLQAHMHGYERFDFGDITYVTTAGGGGLIGDVDANTSRPYCDMRVASGPYYHGLVLDVGAQGISGQAIQYDGKVVDSFSIDVN